MNAIAMLWAKTSEKDEKSFHPLLLHLLDVAASADAILKREPESTRERMAAILGLSWQKSYHWLLLLIACHDLGKATPGFQTKWQKARELLSVVGIPLPRIIDTEIRHGTVTQIALAELLINAGWPDELALRCAEAVGCHHGVRASATSLDHHEYSRYGVDKKNWQPLWKDIYGLLSTVFPVDNPPLKADLSGPDFMLLAGLASFSDWIGSNEQFFPFGEPGDCEEPQKWFTHRCQCAETALDTIGWLDRSILLSNPQSFTTAFPKCSPARPLQEAVAEAVCMVPEPCVLLVEAPMGEGKTEAALFSHLELQRRFGHRGMYIALPSKATGNAMFTRVLSFLKRFANDRTIDLQLLHGASSLNDDFQKLRITQICDDAGNGAVCAGEWFTNKKRALLSEYGVGTIDQALLTILPVRHHFVRLWGLANRVVIFDEIHAYDAYTGTLLFHLIKWLRALGSSIILLSATLPPALRRRLADMLGSELSAKEAEYPRLTLFLPGKTSQSHFSADMDRRLEVTVLHLESSLSAIKACIEERLPDSGYAGVIVNTVQRAQDLYTLFPKGEKLSCNGIVIGKRLPDGTEIHLFHARYPAQDRQQREDAVLSIYGKNPDSAGNAKQRNGRCILIATQVAEQSLDLDFDLLISDLAPIDLILQRAGRLWRHKRGPRSVSYPFLCITGLTGEKPRSFGDPLWWDCVYREDILLRTWYLLNEINHQRIVLPDAIDNLVCSVYEGFSLPADEDMQKRYDHAEIQGEGQSAAQKTVAHQAIIGLPDDASWKDANRLCLFDENEPGVHITLKAQTRLGEDSVTAIPIYSDDKYNQITIPDFAYAKMLALRSISVSRIGAVKRLRSLGIPAGWSKSPMLRNCYPLIFDKSNTWTEDSSVKVDEELGIVYMPKETQ